MDNSPLRWNEFFDEKLTIDVKSDRFNVYVKGNEGPIFYLIHGGGYTGLTWACFAEELSSKVRCRIWAPDLRGHGETTTQDDKDLSLARQVRDVEEIYAKLLERYDLSATPPASILIGHSMGGAIAVHVARAGRLTGLVALAVVDVVEGSAMAAFGHMSALLLSRPAGFESVERAIHWCTASGKTRNTRAARVSMPSQIVEASSPSGSGAMRYRWRTNLTVTQPFWNGWFHGLSETFMSCTTAKILILANVERLDTALTTGQMRGLFQTEILPKVGHAIHEDSPAAVADIFVKLVNRYRVIIDKMSRPAGGAPVK